jgi:hypothetical protein
MEIDASPVSAPEGMARDGPPGRATVPPLAPTVLVMESAGVSLGFDPPPQASANHAAPSVASPDAVLMVSPHALGGADRQASRAHNDSRTCGAAHQWAGGVHPL